MTKPSTVDVAELAKRIDEGCPPLSENGRSIAIAVYRLLALGDPVPDYALAAATRLDISTVRREMEGWPAVYRNDGGRIIGFWGLSVVEMDHTILIDGRRLYAWCAWDTLFIPGILGEEVEVRSRCAESGEEVSLSVGRRGVVRSSHEGAVMSMVELNAEDVEADRVISSFCHHILFFRSVEAGALWVSRRDDPAQLLTLGQGFELAQRFNGLRFGEALK